MYLVLVRITLRPSILDPQGKAIERALHDLGQTAVSGVRTGKHIELAIEAGSAEAAEATARTACSTLLANPVTEDFVILDVTPVQEAATV
ncbi:MAG: phosphoribosylformylglycinamidine synthase subunit PurS [Rubricoccaceae bacterium]